MRLFGGVIRLLILCFSFFPYHVSAQRCEEVKEMLHENEIPLIIESGAKFSIDHFAKSFFGLVPSIVSKIITPSKISTPKDQYLASLRKIERLVFDQIETEKIQKAEIQIELERLLIAEEGIIIESGFKPGSECYQAIKMLSNNIVKLTTSIGVGVKCQYYRFYGDIERGTNCNNLKSARIRVVNTLNQKMKMWGSFQKTNGEWTSWEVYNVSPGGKGVWWACETTGNYVVIGLNAETSTQLFCNKMKQQDIFNLR